MRRTTIGRLPAALATITGAIFGALVLLPDSFAGDAEPLPARPPARDAGPDPWPGYRPGREGRSYVFPLEASADPARWEAFREGMREGSAVPPAESLPAPAPVEAGRFAREAPPVEEAWNLAIRSAESADAEATLEALAREAPRTVAGQDAWRRLAFAVFVAKGDRHAADSLFYRISWDDAGGTASRLAIWRTLDERDGAAAEATISGLDASDPGILAARTMARWMTEPGAPDVDARIDGSGMARNALVLATARSRVLEGDLVAAREAFRELHSEELPDSWRPVSEALDRLTSGVGAGGIATPDRMAYRAIAERYLESGDVGTEAGSWLAEFPDSDLRGHLYLMRAHESLASKDPGNAEGDLRAAASLGGAELRFRARLADAFRLAQEGDGSGARAALEALRGDPGASGREAEWLFARTRLARLTGSDGLDIALIELQEAYPGSPWEARASNDTDAPAWGEPLRALPPEPEPERVVAPPEDGPWASLLWGEDVLSRTALELETASPSAPEEPSELAKEPAPSSAPRVIAGIATGAPAALGFEVGAGGLWKDVHYQWTMAQTFADDRHSLPEGDRRDWELAVGGRPKGADLGLVLDGAHRRDHAAPELGLGQEPVESGTFGARADVSFRGVGSGALGLSLSRVRGDLNTGSSQQWETDQTWMSATAEFPMTLGTLEGGWTAARLQNQDPGEAKEGRWYQDLRVVLRRPLGWYLGVRAAADGASNLLAPVAGIRVTLPNHLGLWASSEPRMEPTDFRRTFVENGDWNVPDLSLLAERRVLDFGGGLTWKPDARFDLGARADWSRTDRYRTWRREGSFFQETGQDGVTGVAWGVSAGAALGVFRGSLSLDKNHVTRDGNQVPYVASTTGRLGFGVQLSRWRLLASTLRVAGRRDEAGLRYGDFFRCDLEAAYGVRPTRLPLGADRLEATLRVENVTGADDRRWPGLPAYGPGVYAGLRLLYGH